MSNDFAPLVAVIAGVIIAIWLFQSNRHRWGRRMLGNLMALQAATVLFVAIAIFAAVAIYATFAGMFWLFDRFV